MEKLAIEEVWSSNSQIYKKPTRSRAEGAGKNADVERVPQEGRNLAVRQVEGLHGAGEHGEAGGRTRQVLVPAQQ